MAARKHLSHDARTREKIQTSQLVNRLQSYVNSEVELSTGQLRAIEILLKKTLPDLQAITLQGDADNPVVAEVVFRGLNG